MGKIVISSNVTLDGVVQDPDGQEGFERGGWFHQSIGARDFEAWVAHETAEALGAEALLLGRRSFEWFASRSPSMSARVSRTWADRMDQLPKHVVSSTLEHPQWRHARVLRGDAAGAIAELKRQIDGDILVYASYRLVRMLIQHDLADELRLMVFPIVLGVGRRLFDEVGNKSPLRLLDMRKIGDSLAYCAYEFAPR